MGIQSGYNVGYSNYPIHPPMKGIYDFRGNYEDGFIYCEFKRPSVLTVEPIQHNNRFLNSNKTFRLLSDKYVVFLAEGSFRDGRISKHTLKDSSSDPLVIAYFKMLEEQALLKHLTFTVSWNCRKLKSQIRHFH